MAVKVLIYKVPYSGNKKDPSDLLARDVLFHTCDCWYLVYSQVFSNKQRFSAEKVKSNFEKYSRADGICQSGYR